MLYSLTPRKVYYLCVISTTKTYIVLMSMSKSLFDMLYRLFIKIPLIDLFLETKFHLNRLTQYIFTIHCVYCSFRFVILCIFYHGVSLHMKRDKVISTSHLDSIQEVCCKIPSHILFAYPN